jgi:hypothetical protein
MSKENFSQNPHLHNEEKRPTNRIIKNTLQVNAKLNKFCRTWSFHCGGYEGACVLDITPLIG